MAKLVPIGEEIKRLSQDLSHIDAVLSNGAERAENIAQPVLSEVREIIGLI